MSNRFITKVILAGFLFTVCSTGQLFSQKHQEQLDREKLRKLEYDWIMAEFKADTAFISSILDSGFISIDSAGILNKQEELTEVYETVMQMHKAGYFVDSVYLDDVHIQLYKNAAIVTFICKTNGRAKHIPYTGRKTRFYDVWIKINGRWKAVSSQVTRMHSR